MSIQQAPFGKVDGQDVQLYTLKNRNNLTVKITNYGAIITHILVPDRHGKLADVVLGFDTLEPYTAKHPYFGAIVGRVANRIANARFSLNGREYPLAANNGPNHLHGGLKGFDKKVWTAQPRDTADGPSLTLTLRSPDGDEGYPGNLDVQVVYTLTHHDELKMEMTATSDAPTPVNLANHSYWNLAGHDSGTILDHVMQLTADNYTPVNDALIPTGEIAPVSRTPYDFTQPKKIGAEIAKLPPSADGKNPGGYDINFALGNTRLNTAVIVKDPTSGRTMEVLTSEPGVQFYTGNFLDGSLKGKGGAVYRKHQGFCLETQHFPDAVNQPNFLSVVLVPGQTYQHTVIHKFSVTK